jgi:hypothetical protein
VRVDGIDTESGKHRPRQLGTYSSQRAARQAVAELLERGDVESAVRAKKGTVGELVDAWAASKVDVTAKSRLQYEWAAGHIRKGLGGIPLDQLTREDVARWIDEMAASGEYARSTVQLFRMVLRAALDEAVAEGRLRRSPAARVGMPRHVAKPDPVVRCRRGPRTTSAASSTPARTIGGTGRSASTCSTACAAVSCSG